MVESAKKRILVVDDEHEQVSIVKKRLEAVGYEVEAASGGEEALGKVRQNKPDLVVLDVMMSGMNGFEVCNILGSGQDTHDIPVVMLTAHTSANEIKRGMEAGAVSYVQKPLKMDVLLGIIKGVIG